MNRSWLVLCGAILVSGCGGHAVGGPEDSFPLESFADRVSRGEAAWTDLVVVIVGHSQVDGVAHKASAVTTDESATLDVTETGNDASSTARRVVAADPFHALLEICSRDPSQCDPPDQVRGGRFDGYSWTMMIGTEVDGYHEESAATALAFLPLIEELAP